MSVTEESIVRVAARGEGVTESGRHVPLAAPGDRVRADGSLIPGAFRQVAPCKHYPGCGGCQLQHLDDHAYAQYLFDRVEGALAAQGLSTEIRTPLISPPRTRRRATLHAERRGRQVHLGFTQAQSHHLIDLDECWVLAPELFAMLQPLRGLLAAQLPQTGRIDVHMTLVDQGIDLLLKGRLSDGLAATEAISAFAGRHRLARLSVDDAYGPETRWEPEPVTVTLGGVTVPMPAGSFLQATREGEAALTDAARSIVGDARNVADLFAGLGTFALAMEPNKRVYAAEGAREAILSLKGAAARAGRQVFADHRDLFRRPLTPDELNRFDAVILDPPRAGAREQAAGLAACRVPKVAYISCNPSSFARDAKAMCEGGYRLDHVQPVGQFTWSTHVELVASFSR